MQKKILFISEILSNPFDEGIKNVAFSLYRQFEIKKNSLSVTKIENDTGDLNIVKLRLNKLFLNYKLMEMIKKYSPDVILYLPEASFTVNSFIRARMLKLMSNMAKVVILGLQHRGYSSLISIIISNFLKPDLLLLSGKSDEDFFLKKGLKVKVLPPAVDTIKFCPTTLEEKMAIRAEYKIPNDKTIVLHVGHIKDERNIECLLEIQKINGVQVIIVGSTTTAVEETLKNRLEKEGIRVINEFIPDISKVYKMSDIYVFPVIKNTAAIEMPLSVLEAMSCNLPVISTRFGGLIDFFKEDEGFRYFQDTAELVRLVKNMPCTEIHNNKKVESFTWNRFADEVLTACEELI